MATTTENKPKAAAKPRRRRRALLGGLVGLAVVIPIGLYYYRLEWSRVREDLKGRDFGDFQNIRTAFLKDIEEGRLETAYEATSYSFRRKTSRKAFEERALRYRDFQKKPDVQGTQASAFAAVEPDDSSHTARQLFLYSMEDSAGNRLRFSIAVVREDGYFHFRPPAARIDAFIIDANASGLPAKR